ncbi:MAG: nucleotide pyrophosphohydrolase [Anaerolineae bacterium]|nr:nucleotide pyrophosphohydrolase [Anaerolineae bacterium]
MNWQQQAVQFAQHHHCQHTPPVHALDLVSEVGELCKVWLEASHYGTITPQYPPEMAEEFGDVLYSLCLLAEACTVDLDAAFQAALVKYEQRWQAKGDIGSHATLDN